MEAFVVLAGIAAFFIIKAVRNNSRRVADAWGDAAAVLGLSFDSGSLTRKKRIHGLHAGHRVEVQTYTRSAGQKSQHQATRYRVHFAAPLVTGLKLKPQGLFSTAAAFFGAQDISTGDADFDKRVVVKGDIPNRVIGFLSRERRQEVLRLFDEFKGVSIDDQSIEWSKSGVAKHAVDIVSTVERLSSAASILAADEPQAAAIADVVLPTAAAATAAVLLDLTASAEPMPAAADAPPAAPAATPSDGPAAAEIAAELFSRGVTSTEAKKRFEQAYKGKRVRWSGSLRRAAAYSIDLTFKGGAGTKATFALPVPSDGALGGAVQAVVQLPPGAAESLRSRVGEQIAFEGRLLSCETLLRSFNVADASLLD